MQSYQHKTFHLLVITQIDSPFRVMQHTGAEAACFCPRLPWKKNPLAKSERLIIYSFRRWTASATLPQNAAL